MTAQTPIQILPYFKGSLGGPLLKRFWEKIDKAGPDDCWEWNLSTYAKGYGRFKIASYTTVHANRVALALHTGSEPEGMLALHSCDNPPCCNPAHLRWGTALENNMDKIIRGRNRCGDHSGERNPACKLDASQIEDIVLSLQRREMNTAIARRHGVTHSLISRIRLGKTWARQTAALGWAPPTTDIAA